MYPLVGKLSSNIITRRISSVRARRFDISLASVLKTSSATRPTAYSVEHLSDIIDRMRSNPNLLSSLVSVPGRSIS